MWKSNNEGVFCMEWSIEYIKEAQRDLRNLDPQIRRLVLKAVQKTAERPLPPPEGIGKPLGNHMTAKLSGYYKIKLRDIGYRVVYGIVRENNIMKVIVISVRNDELVYREAERRIQNMIKPE